jgi:hypothetical protein
VLSIISSYTHKNVKYLKLTTTFLALRLRLVCSLLHSFDDALDKAGSDCTMHRCHDSSICSLFNPVRFLICSQTLQNHGRSIGLTRTIFHFRSDFAFFLTYAALRFALSTPSFRKLFSRQTVPFFALKILFIPQTVRVHFLVVLQQATKVGLPCLAPSPSLHSQPFVASHVSCHCYVSLSQVLFAVFRFRANSIHDSYLMTII